MSRSNTHYYNICDGPRFEVGEDGYCDYHRTDWYGRQRQNIQRLCIPPGEFYGRRGLVKRKRRFPNTSWKSWCSGPPHDVKRAWQRRLRAMYRAEMLRHTDDPELMHGCKWLAGMYDWWS